MTKMTCTEMAKNFCRTLENAGYFAGVYSFDSFFGSNLDDEICSLYTCWVARVENIKPKICKKYDIHQYSWKGKVDGIKGDVDMNDCTRNFPSIIKNAGLNGFKKTVVTTPPPIVKPETPVWTVNATISNLTETAANAIKTTCASMGMNVAMSK